MCVCFQIRRMMIDGETGERTIHTLVKSQDEVRESTQKGFINLPCLIRVF